MRVQDAEKKYTERTRGGAPWDIDLSLLQRNGLLTLSAPAADAQLAQLAIMAKLPPCSAPPPRTHNIMRLAAPALASSVAPAAVNKERVSARG